MAENKGKTAGSEISAKLSAVVQSGQMAVGGTLAGAQAAMGPMTSDGAIQLLDDMKQIALENEKNTENLYNVFLDMFQFDKETYARERDQLRESRKEALKQKGEGFQLPDKEEMTGGLTNIALAGITGSLLALKQFGMDLDFLKLPQQIRSFRGIVDFFKGMAGIGTLGLGPKLIDDFKAAVTAAKVDPKDFKAQYAKIFENTINSVKGTPDNPGVFARLTAGYTRAIDSVADTFKATKDTITNSKVFTGVTTFLDDIKVSIQTVTKPIVDSFRSLFAPADAAAGTKGGALTRLVAMLRPIGTFIGKLFLPLSIILGVFDGYAGFEEEYKDKDSILDGIRGAIKGIVDGFVGSFVRIIGSAFDMVLEFLGLDKAGESISQFSKDVTAGLEKSVGGLIDIITGVFSFDPTRVMQGIKALVGGTIDWASDILFAPINLAIGFVQDLFGIGEKDAPPFNLKDFLFSTESGDKRGVFHKAIDKFKKIFEIDFSGIKDNLFDFGAMLKAVTVASGAYVATLLNPFTKGSNIDAAKKAYTDAFAEAMSGGTVANADGSTTSSEGTVTLQDGTVLSDQEYRAMIKRNYELEMQRKAEIEKEVLKQNAEYLLASGANQQGSVVSYDSSKKQNNNIMNKTENSYLGPSNMLVDSYHNAMSGYSQNSDPTIKIQN